MGAWCRRLLRDPNCGRRTPLFYPVVHKVELCLQSEARFPAAASLLSSLPLFSPPFLSIGCCCPRAFAHAVPPAWNTLPLDLPMLAPSCPPGWTPMPPSHACHSHPTILPHFTQQDLKLVWFVFFIPPASLECKTPEREPGPGTSQHVSPGPRPSILRGRKECAHCTSGYFFLKSLLDTAGTRLIRISTLSESRRICLRKWKRNIYLSSINI